MRFAAGIVVTAGVVYLLACLALFLLQRSFIFYPQPRSFGSADTVMKMKVPGAELTVRRWPEQRVRRLLSHFGR